MLRVIVVAAAIVALVVGVGIGMSARSIVGDKPAPDESASAPPTLVPTSVAVATPTRGPSNSAATGTQPGAVAAAPASRDVVMEVSEADLNKQFGSMLVGQSLGKTPLGDATVQSVNVQLRDRQVKLDGDATVGFLRSPFTVIGTVTPNAAGRPMVNVSQATVGGVVLPQSARDALAESVQSQVDGMFNQGNVKVRTIDIDDGKMRLVGTTNS